MSLIRKKQSCTQYIFQSPTVCQSKVRKSVVHKSAMHIFAEHTLVAHMYMAFWFAVCKSAVCFLAVCLLAVCMLCGCGKHDGNKNNPANEKLKGWLEEAALDDRLGKDELYAAALNEGTLVVYSVSGRAFQAKEAFEKEYPGLSVEVKDIRSGDVVDMLKNNYETGNYACDVVICSDCDGSLYKELIEPGIIYSYIPWDIAPKLKAGYADAELNFLGEAMMIFYNTDIFDSQPIDNFWELTEEKYYGKIMMSSPLSSFSTYGFCARILQSDDEFRKAYEVYAGKPLEVPDGETAGMVFFRMLGKNLRYVNSNDEVLEGVGNSEDAWIGMIISSKMRYLNLGYHFAPILRLEPFASVFTPNSIALAGGAENINTAKLFIRYILGETDGTSQGAAAFTTDGSWSARTDMPDGCRIPIEDIDIVFMDKTYLYANRQKITEFFGKLLEGNGNSER